MAEPDDDADLSSLLWLVAAGDHLAFQRLYAHAAPRLFAVALRVTGDEALAIEALHATLIQIWRRTLQFRPLPGATPQGWLIAQLRSRAIELVRRRQRDGMPSEVFSRNADIEAGLARLSATPDGLRLRTALAQLDGQRRDIIVMAFLDGMSFAEMGQKLRLPIGTIKSWTRRSLISLRTALERAA